MLNILEREVYYNDKIYFLRNDQRSQEYRKTGIFEG